MVALAEKCEIAQARQLAGKCVKPGLRRASACVLRIAIIRAQSPDELGRVRRWDVSRMNKRMLSRFGAAALAIGLIGRRPYLS